MKTIIVRAEFECMVQKDGETIGVLENDVQEVIVKENKDFVLTLFPLNNFECLPYSCKIYASGGELFVNTNRGVVTKMPHESYEIVFYPYQLNYQEPIVEQSQNINSPLSNVEIKIIKQFGAQNYVQILQIWEKNNNVYSYKLSSQIQNPQISNAYINNEFFIIINGYVDDYEYALIVSTNGKYQAVLELLCHKIEIGEKGIKTLTKCFDINKHGKVCVYEVVNSKIAKTDEYLVNLKENIKVLPQIVPFAFFESLKLGDIKLCRSYLTDNLNNSIDDAHLKAYFGNFEQVRQNAADTELNTIILIYKKEDAYIGKMCKFQMCNDKIDNFELLEN